MAKRGEIYSIPEKYLILSSSSHDGPSESPLEPFQNFYKKIILWVWSIESTKKNFFLFPQQMSYSQLTGHISWVSFTWKHFLEFYNNLHPISSPPIPIKHQSLLLHWHWSCQENKGSPCCQITLSHLCPHLAPPFSSIRHSWPLPPPGHTFCLGFHDTYASGGSPASLATVSFARSTSPLLLSSLACSRVHSRDLFSSPCLISPWIISLFYGFRGHLWSLGVSDSKYYKSSPDLSSKLLTLILACL